MSLRLYVCTSVLSESLSVCLSVCLSLGVCFNMKQYNIMT